MALNILDYTTIVRNQVTAIQSRAAGLVDLTIGSLMLAVVEANSGVVQWIQQLIVQLLVTVRAATCSGTDLDSWMADFGFTRLSAVQATGQVTFSRFTATNQAVIPIGSTVTTTDGTQSYTVTLDTTNAAYSATLGGYVIAAGVSSVTVPVLANIAGAAGNALAGMVTVITGGISFVDTVANAAAFANGADKQSDTDFRAAFVLWVASLSKATKAAIGYALASMQTGVTYSLVENQDYSGNVLYGYFYAVVDDGSGNPSSTFLASAASAIESVRPFCSRYGVFGPALLSANVSMVITTDSTVTHSVVVANVNAAIQSYIASLSLGQLLSYSKLISIAYGVTSAITNVTAVTLNGGTADLAATQKQVIRPGTISVA
ncbi:baseplate J/gp47 family protein [Aquitalea aquatica]|uniref:Baseplate J/gp47 family protein n=1 Tax=Aquitalea aquatica TaxID=3044273 RepID=A0A838Y9P7_9NEIS|nr:baseplate J/gp47 family protein [Aquitalea magnusonii]MBA4710568.1 baseplate J/gp47 family protein [Aquitalea magnusonii]